MASAIDIFDALKAKIEATLDIGPSDYQPIENPFIPEDNATALWNKGYGLAFATGLNPEFLNKAQSTFVRDYNVVLINRVNFTQTNVERMEDQQKNLIADMEALQKAFDDDVQVGGVCTKASLLTDTGIGFIDGEQNKFLIVEGNIEVTYFE